MGFDSKDGSTTTYPLLGPLCIWYLAGMCSILTSLPLSLTWSFSESQHRTPSCFFLSLRRLQLPTIRHKQRRELRVILWVLDKIPLRSHLLEPFFTVEIWQYRFAAECVAEVTSRILTAESPSYTTIMELDRKVREFPMPEGISPSSDDLAGSFQKCVSEHIRETGENAVWF